uniref:GYF domain-containing protein n=1 Tax=Trepomonas sp. PC1 TaxID=1076344 RepID=A0A146KIG5_9EUKA|eukprot:JAP95928.1 hypothetical protein TPC1_10905 [Trepomonas sp. PC1]
MYSIDQIKSCFELQQSQPIEMALLKMQHDRLPIRDIAQTPLFLTQRIDCSELLMVNTKKPKVPYVGKKPTYKDHKAEKDSSQSQKANIKKPYQGKQVQETQHVAVQEVTQYDKPTEDDDMYDLLDIRGMTELQNAKQEQDRKQVKEEQIQNIMDFIPIEAVKVQPPVQVQLPTYVTNPQWTYIDNKQNVQGPFTQAQMYGWYSSNRLPQTLMISLYGYDTVYKPISERWSQLLKKGGVPFSKSVLDQ